MAYTSEIEKLERRWLENPKGRNFAPLADAYRKAGELDRAIDLCKSGLERHPDYVSAHIVYGRCLTDLKKDDEAAEVFRKVLELDPENIIALKILGEIAERNNRFDEAVEWLGRLLNADPMNGDAAEHLARAKSKAATAKPLADAPTAPMSQPDFVVEPTSAPAPKRPSGAAPSPDIETFDGSIAFNASAHAAAKADGLEVQEDVELSSQQVERVEIEGLAPTQYEGSGMFRLDTPPPPEAAAPPPPAEDESLPQVDLPLIMPEDLPRTPAAAREPAPKAAPPSPPPPRASVPAAVSLSDDDGAADTAALSKAEPVLTETMAELYLKQGHEQEALRVYQALLVQRPGDAKLKRRVEHLSGGGRKKSGVSAQAFLKSILSGRGAPAAPASAPATTLDAAFDAAAGEGEGGDEGGHPGQPTHPAHDHISLDSVFGEESARRPTSGPAAAAPSQAALSAEGGGGGGGGEGGGRLTLDQFFGGAPGAPGAPGGAAASADLGAEPGARTPGRSSGRTQRPAENEGELDQFQQWLKKLKS